MQSIANFALPLALVLPLAACPSKDGDDAGVSDATTGSTTPTDGGSTAPTTSATSDGETTGGAGVGLCAATCEAPGDCAVMGGAATDWSCVAGFCEFIGIPEVPACDESTCPGGSGLACAAVKGAVACTIPCTAGGTECDASLLECTGQDDAGNSICAPRPCGGVAEGAACTIPMLGQNGTCVDGVCSCTSDTECTFPGYACNPQPRV